MRRLQGRFDRAEVGYHRSMTSRKARRLVELLAEIAEADDRRPALVERFRERYRGLDPAQRAELFAAASSGLELEPGVVEPHLRATLDAVGEPRTAWAERLDELRTALASPRRRALEELAAATGGVSLLVEMRAEVLDAQRSGRDDVGLLERDIADLLNGWFFHGFLFLEEIDHSSSFAKIRFLKERELVHPMVRLEEMGRRLGADRRCFALYHAAMPAEPVVFIEVALARGLIRSIHDIIDERRRDRAPVTDPNTAIFYSINNTQNGLAGLGLGRVLLARVTEALRDRHPGVRTLATLSPVPGFRDRYLLPVLRGDDLGVKATREDLLGRLSGRGRATILSRSGRDPASEDPDELAAALHQILLDPAWIEDRPVVRALRRPLCEIAYAYLSEERDRRGRPLNPVAGFHLGNGATLSARNVNFAANTTPRGLEESCGLMVNYVYSAPALQQIGDALRSLLPWGG